MHRVLLPLLALVLLAPGASASGAGLELEGPASPVQVADGAASVPITVRVTLDGAVCSEETDVHVRLRAYAPGDATAGTPEEVVVHVPAGGYVSQPFAGSADTSLVLQAPAGLAGHVMVAAAYDAPASCVVAGDTHAEAKLDVAFVSAAQPDAPPAAPSAPAPSAPASGSRLDVLPWALGLGIAAVVAFALGRLGQRGEVGGRDGLP